MHRDDCSTGNRRMITTFGIAVVMGWASVISLGLAACSKQDAAGRGPVKVNAGALTAKIYFTPKSVRMFLSDSDNRPVDIEDLEATITVGKDARIRDRSLEKRGTTILVPHSAVRGPIDGVSMPDPIGIEAASGDESVPLEREFFWLPLESEAFPEGAPATITIASLEGGEPPTEIETRVRYASAEGYACPTHFRNIRDEPGTCSRDGLQLESVRIVYRCPMFAGVTGVEPNEKCWMCKMTLRKSLLNDPK